MSSYKLVPCKSTLGAVVGDAYSEFQSLRDEVREIVDNASEGLSQTQRIQTLGETADNLEQYCDEDPDVPASLVELEVSYMEQQHKDKRKGPSRAVRCENAVAMLEAAKEAAESFTSEHVDDPGEVEASEGLCDSLQSMIDTAEGCEFPGMFG